MFDANHQWVFDAVVTAALILVGYAWYQLERRARWLDRLKSVSPGMTGNDKIHNAQTSDHLNRMTDNQTRSRGRAPGTSHKIIQAGRLSPDWQLAIQTEAKMITEAMGWQKQSIGLDGTRLMVQVGKKELTVEKALRLLDFCEANGLELEVQHV